MEYAFDEFYNLLFLHRPEKPFSKNDPTLLYLCALVSELTYYHVPQFEIDDKKRAKIVPCFGYQKIIEDRFQTSIEKYFSQKDLKSYVISERSIISIILQIKDIVFIGFRGTRFLYDWKINFRSRLIPVVNYNRECRCPGDDGKAVSMFHRGFAEEALRISTKINNKINEIRNGNNNNELEIYTTGHSLGGAIAAISTFFFRNESYNRNYTCNIFGSPRYCNFNAYLTSRSFFDRIPIHIRRPDDIVPSVLPRFFGYADHPDEMFTNEGTRTAFSEIIFPFYILSKWGNFIAKRGRPHFMENYRKELGAKINAEGYRLPLIPNDKL